MAANADIPITKPNYPERCGDVLMPYPFGIGRGCYHDLAYEVICNHSTEKPVLKSLNFEIEAIEYLAFQSITVKTPILRTCGVQNNGITTTTTIRSLDLGETPYSYSSLNEFVVWSCGSSVYVRNRNNTLLGVCSSLCDEHGSVNFNSSMDDCNGVGCCRMPLPTNGSLPYDIFRLDISNILLKPNTCTNTMLVSSKAYDYHQQLGVDFLDPEDGVSFNVSEVPTVLNWTVIPTNITMPSPDKKRECSKNNIDTTTREEIHCKCLDYHFGNPYISQGCLQLARFMRY